MVRKAMNSEIESATNNKQTTVRAAGEELQ